MNIEAKQEGVVILKNRATGELTGMVYKDPDSRKNVLFLCREMSISEIEDLFNKNEKSI